MACPLTKGSFGSLSSRGTISDDVGFLDDVVSIVFDRGRNGEEDGAGAAKFIGDGSEGIELGGCFGDSDDWLCPVMGIEAGIVLSSGIASAAGMGRPLPAATSWCSVHSSLKSSRPLQKGAIRRSICLQSVEDLATYSRCLP